MDKLDDEKVSEYLYALVGHYHGAYIHYRWLIEPDGESWTVDELCSWAKSLAERIHVKVDDSATYG